MGDVSVTRGAVEKGGVVGRPAPSPRDPCHPVDPSRVVSLSGNVVRVVRGPRVGVTTGRRRTGPQETNFVFRSTIDTVKGSDRWVSSNTLSGG